MSREAFEAHMRHLGLDPADHDTAMLHEAYNRLRQLYPRLDLADPQPGAEGLSVFDPWKPPS